MTQFDTVCSLTAEHRQGFVAVDIFPTFLKTKITGKTLEKFGKQGFLRHILLRVQLVDKKVQAPHLIEPPVKYDQDQVP